MNAKAKEAILQEYCKILRMPSMFREHARLCRQAREQGLCYEDFLRELLETEVLARRDSSARRHVAQAGFPDVKTLDQIDWTSMTGVSKPRIVELATCAYIARGEDVVIAGPIGTGKTHLAIALGVEAARRRNKVAFVRAAELVRSLREARDDRTLGRLHRRFQGVGLLILDELGFVPFETAEGELLFNLLADRYEKRSTIITTNLAFSEWVQVFQSEKLTTALLDRIGHHAHVLTTRGDSFRTMKKKKEVITKDALV